MQNMEVAFPGFLPEDPEAQSGVEQAPPGEEVKGKKRQIRILKFGEMMESWKQGIHPFGRPIVKAEPQPDVVQSPPKSTTHSPISAAKAAFNAKKRELASRYVSLRAQQEAATLEIMEFCRRNGISEIGTSGGGKIAVRPETVIKVHDRDLLSEALQKHFGITAHYADMIVEAARKPTVRSPMVQYYRGPKGAHKFAGG